MSPADIKEGHKYLGFNGSIYIVNEIYRHKGTKRVRFERKGDEPAFGNWRIEHFVEHLKEEAK